MSSWRIRARRRLGLLTRERLLRSVWLGLLIGIIAGAGAVLFFRSIEFVSEQLLVEIARYQPPNPAGEGGDAVPFGPDRLWILPIVLGLGGLASGIIVALFAPEAEGHGTDAAIDAFHHNAGRVRLRAVPVKLLASALTIGSGGSAGREGPTAQIGAGFGSVLADRLNLGQAERRRALAAGMGSGIGAIFRAPLGGALMAAEVLYSQDFEADVLVLSLISSIVAFTIFGAFTDFNPIFGGASDFAFSQPQELGYYAAIGVVCGLIGILYARTFSGTIRWSARLPGPRWIRPAIGGVAVGCVGMLAPESIHVGYGYIQQALTPEGVASFSLWLLVALPFLRILTVSLSVGTGGSGGIFGPGMVIGGFTGAAIWRLFHDLPGFPAEPGPVVIIAMVAMFGSIAHAPLAMLLMVAEMTGNLSLLAPAMVAVAVASLIVGDAGIYTSQLPTRADSPAHRHRFAFPLLTALPTGRAVRPVSLFEAGTPAADALKALGDTRAVHAVVLDEDREIRGEITAEAIRSALADGSSPTVGELAVPFPAVVAAATPLDDALDILAQHERRWLPVVEGDGGPLVGAIDTRALLRSYRSAAEQQVRPLSPLGDIESIEVTVAERAPAVGRTLLTLGLPAGARVLAILRSGGTLVPSGNTTINAGDRLTLTMQKGQQEEVLDLFLD